MNRKKMWVAYVIWMLSLGLFMWMASNTESAALVALIASTPVLERTVRWAHR